MNKITYIFGAGASANALPVVKAIPKSLETIISKLTTKSTLQLEDTKFAEAKIKNAKTYHEYQIEMVESLKWLQSKANEHASVDTFAKKLKIKRQYEDLKRLKIALSVFFVLEQTRNKPDPRYDTFYASILERIDQFPEHIRILSWNYDIQFELAYKMYTESNDLLVNQNRLNIFSKHSKNDYYGNKGFTIYKLNGTTGFRRTKSDDYFNLIQEISSELKINIVRETTVKYVLAKYDKDVFPTLSFAWEKDLNETDILSSAINDIKDTKVIVIIGYSFPFFNRDVDNQILANMKNLQKIYVQDPHAENIIERIKAALGNRTLIKVLPINETDQFYLPNEL